MRNKTFTLLFTIFMGIQGFAQLTRVEPNTSLKIEDGTSLDITQGDLIIESDNSGDASLIDLGEVTYSGGGIIHVDRYLTNGKWHLISSPVQVAEANLFLNDYLQYHTESTNDWTDINSLSAPLEVMQGYSIWSTEPGPTIESYTGISNTGTQYIAFTKTSAGFNLLGNPYPSSIDWNEVNLPSNLNGQFYLWDPGIGLNGDYVYYIGGGGPANTTSQFIPSGQGLFVEATGNGTLTLDNNVRSHGSQLFYKSQVTNPMLVLKVSGNGVSSQAAVRFNVQATDAIDRLLDVRKIISGNNDIPNLYSFAEEEKMAINTLPGIPGHETIPMAFEAGLTGNYTLLATELQSIPDEVAVYLEDVPANHTQDLRAEPAYTFFHNAGTTRDLRIHFKNATGISTPETTVRLNVRCNLNENVLNIWFDEQDFAGSEQKTTLKVFSLTGQQVLSQELNGLTHQISFRGSASVYLLQITSSKGVFLTKLVNQ